MNAPSLHAAQLPVTVMAATLGPIGLEARKTLHFGPREQTTAHAALLLLPAGTRAPANCSGWRHRFVDGELPLLVLTGVSGRVAHHLALNLFDSGTRGAFEMAVSKGALELLMQTAYGSTAQLHVTLSTSELGQVRTLVNRYRRAHCADSNAWWTRMLLAANELPATISKDDAVLTRCEQHFVALLNGDAEVHVSALDLATFRAGLSSFCEGVERQEGTLSADVDG